MYREGIRLDPISCSIAILFVIGWFLIFLLIKNGYNNKVAIQQADCSSNGGEYHEIYKSDDVCYIDGKLSKIYDL